MNKPFYNDQAHIAEEFYLAADHTTQTAWLAFFKINSYKLSLSDTTLCISREELTGFIKSSLLNYTDPTDLLSGIGFFTAELDN